MQTWFRICPISSGHCNKLPGFPFKKEGITPPGAGGASGQELSQLKRAFTQGHTLRPGKTVPSSMASKGSDQKELPPWRDHITAHLTFPTVPSLPQEPISRANPNPWHASLHLCFLRNPNSDAAFFL